MIVRVAGDGQYEVPDDAYAELDALDNETVACVRNGDEQGFHRTFGRMVALVRERGARLDADDLRPSEIILPPPDISIWEAEEEFQGEGIVPDLPAA